eukprot:9216334-Alexandrium_andersonii.AAC.1
MPTSARLRSAAARVARRRAHSASSRSPEQARKGRRKSGTFCCPSLSANDTSQRTRQRRNTARQRK